MKLNTTQILRILHALSWILFIGLCIQAGGFIFNTFYTLVINPVDAGHFWTGVDFSSLYHYSHGHFLAEASLMCLVTIGKAYLFYLIVKMLSSKNWSISQPFSKELGQFIFKMAKTVLLIGVLSGVGIEYTITLMRRGVTTPGIDALRFGGADIWLFMGMALLVIAQIFKRGIELQTENELTV